MPRASVSVSHICRCSFTIKSELKSYFPRCAYVTLVGTNHTVKFTSQTLPVMSRTGCCIRHTDQYLCQNENASDLSQAVQNIESDLLRCQSVTGEMCRPC